jgi:hypothetical protein
MKASNFTSLFLATARGMGIIVLLLSSAVIGALSAALLHIFTDFFDSKSASQSLTLIYQFTFFYAQFSILATILIGPLLMVFLKLMRLPLSMVVCMCCGVVIACVPLSILVGLTIVGQYGPLPPYLLFMVAIALIGGATGGGFFGIIWKLVMSKREQAPERLINDFHK